MRTRSHREQLSRSISHPRIVHRSSWRRVALAAVFLLVVGCTAGGVSADELERIGEVLGLDRGSVVADVGAGEGEWVVKLAALVGEEGHVFATEVEASEVEDIERRVQRAFLNNVTVVLGNQAETGLPVQCCDAILLRMVYHHFTDPAKMRTSLWEALRPQGLIAVIDITPQTSWRDLPDVPDRGGHGIASADLIHEMTAHGFEVVMREEHWDGDEDRYCIVFRR